MRWITFVMVLAAAPACGGSQTPERGAAFCKSYQDNYLGTCRQQCEKGIDAGDREASEECQNACEQDLREDDTFNDDCPERASRL